MSLWSRYFRGPTWTGANPGEGEYDPGEAAPACQILHELRRRARQHAKLLEIFGADKMKVLERLPDQVSRTLHELWFYTGAISPLFGASPGGIDVFTTRIYLTIAYGVQDLDPIVREGEVTMATPLEVLKNFVRAEQELTVTPVGGTPIQMVRPNVTIAEHDLFVLPITAMVERPMAEARGIQVDYRTFQDRDTGHLQNLP